MLPLFKESSAMSGESLYTNVELVNFTTNRKTCGARQAAIMPFLQPDYTPFATMKNIRMTNVAHEAVAFIQDPNPGWANDSDCVEFTCTGMYNIVIYMEGVTLSGTTTPFVPPNFSIVADNKESTSVQVIAGCTKESQWNSWLCNNRDVGVMLFDNRDADRMDRAVHPVWIQNEESGFNNRLNSFMDHCWDGFYTCQKRESRFPTVVQLGDDYNIEYTGTPPAEQEFRLFGRTGAPGSIVTIKYNAAGAYQILDKNRNIVEPTSWDPVAMTWAEVSRSYCGQFRYEGGLNRLQFYLDNTDDCVVYVKPRDAIMLKIRLEFTLEEFFADGGVVSFTDRMAGVLGIHASDMLIVSVYEGSTIVEW